MRQIFFLDRECPSQNPVDLGGKGAALCRLLKSDLTVPRTLCLTTGAYRHFLQANGLGEKILMELSRKEFASMRWEEMWDASLRIRHHFLAAQLPEDMVEAIAEHYQMYFPGQAVAIRSSAPEEDTVGASFAGLHDSYLNISGIEAVLDHVVKVWASLWSDRALLYRRELGLDIDSSSMAVIIQELSVGECSGIVFSEDPADTSRLIIEAVYGLNEGLVDGTIEPDRWFLSRESGHPISHVPPGRRDRQTTVQDRGTGLTDIPDPLRGAPPLDEQHLKLIYSAALQIEALFGRPQDIEWTLADHTLYILQARPITTIARDAGNDKRSWYLSLHRSFDNLAALKERIEQDLLPGMDQEAARLAATGLARLSDIELAEEIRQRITVSEKWGDVYWSEFIPFAHGMRIFGEVYNDLLNPDDPYEFVLLLQEGNLLSTRRNDLLGRLAAEVKNDSDLKRQLQEKKFGEISNSNFLSLLEHFNQQFTTPALSSLSEESSTVALEGLAPIILQYARLAGQKKPVEGINVQLESRFLAVFEKSALPFSGPELLALARASYRLRDDDNIHLGKIEHELVRAANAGKMRLLLSGMARIKALSPADTAELLQNPGFFKEQMEKKGERQGPKTVDRIRARQITGQPASKGIARGKCRVIRDNAELTRFKKGEILIADAIDPNMTFIAPLAAAIVERRGGMLIHGAIIAREYGIPCVTGVPDIIDHASNGDMVTVDGYLGIVTLGG